MVILSMQQIMIFMEGTSIYMKWSVFFPNMTGVENIRSETNLIYVPPRLKCFIYSSNVKRFPESRMTNDQYLYNMNFNSSHIYFYQLCKL